MTRPNNPDIHINSIAIAPHLARALRLASIRHYKTTHDIVHDALIEWIERHDADTPSGEPPIQHDPSAYTQTTLPDDQTLRNLRRALDIYDD